MDYKIIDPLNFDNWDKNIGGFKNRSVFHTSEWIRVLGNTYNYTPKSFVFQQGDSVQGIVPILEVDSYLTGKRGVSLPFSDHCDPLINEDLDMSYVIPKLIDYGAEQKWDYLELRCLENTVLSENYSSYYLGHILQLSDNTDDLYSAMKSSIKRNIKKAIKENVKVKFANTLASMQEYFMLHCITRKRQGVPPQSFQFFANIYNEIIAPGKGNIITGWLGDKIIAAAIFIHSGKKVVYKFGASDYNYQNTRVNNLIFWEAIKYYSKEGYTSFDFGRTDPGQDGLRQFKLGWGSEEKKIKYFRYDIKSRALIDNSHSNGRITTKLFNMLPANVLKLIGAKLYRHMG